MESTIELITETISDWKKALQENPAFKLFKGAWDIFSFADSTYGFIDNILYPKPDQTALILEAINELDRKIEDRDADVGIAKALSVIKTYRSYCLNKNNAVLPVLQSDVHNSRENLAQIIQDWSIESVIRAAELYNTLVLISAYVELQLAASSQQKGKVDWEQIKSFNSSIFREAMQINKILIGSFSFSKPSDPQSQYKGISLYNGDGRIHPSKNPDYQHLYQTIWSANEKLRESLIKGYPENLWLKISNKDRWRKIKDVSRDPRCLPSFDSYEIAIDLSVSPTNSSVVLGSPTPTKEKGLWKIEHLTYNLVKIKNQSGKYLTYDFRSRRFYCLDRNGSGSGNHFEVCVQEGKYLQHYWCDGRWRKGIIIGQNVSSSPAFFQSLIPSKDGYDYNVFVTETKHIQHYFYEWGGRGWCKGQRFGSDLCSDPVAWQTLSHWLKVGDVPNLREIWEPTHYDVVVREGNHLQHYYSKEEGIVRERPTKASEHPLLEPRKYVWCQGQRFGESVTSAPALLSPGLILVREHNYLCLYSRQDGQWREIAKFGKNIESAPAGFVNRANQHPEIFVCEDGQVQHYWSSDKIGKSWHKGQKFGDNVCSMSAFQNLENNNYEVFAQQNRYVQHYWRSWQDGRWRKGQRFGENVKSAPVAFQNFEYKDFQVFEIGGAAGKKMFIRLPNQRSALVFTLDNCYASGYGVYGVRIPACNCLHTVQSTLQ